MAVNKYKPHVWVMPEDDATRQLANGFLLHPALDSTCIDIRQAPGGWIKVFQAFDEIHLADLRKYPERHLVLLIDFDERVEGRTEHFRRLVPNDVSQRVYVLGASSEPEPLRTSIGMSLELIGTALAESCAAGSSSVWDHDLLKHNHAERERLVVGVRPFLFACAD